MVHVKKTVYGRAIEIFVANLLITCFLSRFWSFLLVILPSLGAIASLILVQSMSSVVSASYRHDALASQPRNR